MTLPPSNHQLAAQAAARRKRACRAEVRPRQLHQSTPLAGRLSEAYGSLQKGTEAYGRLCKLNLDLRQPWPGGFAPLRAAAASAQRDSRAPALRRRWFG